MFVKVEGFGGYGVTEDSRQAEVEGQEDKLAKMKLTVWVVARGGFRS